MIVFILNSNQPHRSVQFSTVSRSESGNRVSDFTFFYSKKVWAISHLEVNKCFFVCPWVISFFTLYPNHFSPLSAQNKHPCCFLPSFICSVLCCVFCIICTYVVCMITKLSPAVHRRGLPRGYDWWPGVKKIIFWMSKQIIIYSRRRKKEPPHTSVYVGKVAL